MLAIHGSLYRHLYMAITNIYHCQKTYHIKRSSSYNMVKVDEVRVFFSQYKIEINIKMWHNNKHIDDVIILTWAIFLTCAAFVSIIGIYIELHNLQYNVRRWEQAYIMINPDHGNSIVLFRRERKNVLFKHRHFL